MTDPSQQPQPLLASGWQRGCGQMIMMLGIALTAFSGLRTMGMMVADLSDTGHHSGDINLSGIQYIFGAPFIVIGALIWWGGWAIRRKNSGGAIPPDRAARDDGSSFPPKDV